MKILALETSTMFGGAAIMDEAEGLLAEVRLNVRSTHSEKLMTAVDSAMRQAGIVIDDIDVFCAAAGPGSFTGLRIGLSTVKGFSFATGKPMVSVSTLEALAWNFPYCCYPVCTMFDARKKEVYAAVFKWKHHDFEKTVSETSVNPVELIRSFEGPNIYAGEGALLHRETIIALAGKNALFPPPQQMSPSPANVAFLGLKKALSGDFSEPPGLVPLYIRRSEAEVKYSQKL